MAYLLDTSIAIHAYDGSERVLTKLSQHLNAVVISALCVIELRRGLCRHPALVVQSRARLDALLDGIPMLDFDRAAVDAYDRIIAQLGFVRGRDFDRMIAAHALSVNAVLVTDNEDDFSDIPGLLLENWSAA
ncbi:MAG: type II toxin-antitoxin system VapC family toxin [Rhizomicrobium sp.]